MCQSDNCKSTFPVIGSFFPSSVLFSNDSSLRPLSHRTCNIPFGWPCQPARIVSRCRYRSTLRKLANSSCRCFFCVALLLLKQTPTPLRESRSNLFDLYTSLFFPIVLWHFVMPSQFSLIRRHVERPRVFVLKHQQATECRQHMNEVSKDPEIHLLSIMMNLS